MVWLTTMIDIRLLSFITQGWGLPWRPRAIGKYRRVLHLGFLFNSPASKYMINCDYLRYPFPLISYYGNPSSSAFQHLTLKSNLQQSYTLVIVWTCEFHLCGSTARLTSPPWDNNGDINLLFGEQECASFFQGGAFSSRLHFRKVTQCIP